MEIKYNEYFNPVRLNMRSAIFEALKFYYNFKPIRYT